jgi:uncharacterized membrane protein YidH (DUF202 family)
METPDGIRMRDFAAEHVKDSTTTESEPSTQTRISSFWSKYVRLIIEEDDCRDHLALERTFLAYIRTASAYAQFGVLMSQLFRLNDSDVGFRVPTTLTIGNAVGASTVGVAIVIVLTGAGYFVKQQRGLVRGVILSRGYDVPVIMVFSFVLLSIILGLLASADRW